MFLTDYLLSIYLGSLQTMCKTRITVVIINIGHCTVLGYVKASKFYAVPKSTLGRWVRNGNKTCCDHITSLGRPAIIPQPLEHELTEYILNMESMLFGLTVDDLKLLAYELAVRNDLQNPYNKELHKAGDSWYYGLRKRHSEI